MVVLGIFDRLKENVVFFFLCILIFIKVYLGGNIGEALPGVNMIIIINIDNFLWMNNTFDMFINLYENPIITLKWTSSICYWGPHDKNFSHIYIWQCTLCRRYIARDNQVTRVKYNQYTSCRLKVLAKWLKICRVMIKRVLIFLEGNNFLWMNNTFDMFINLYENPIITLKWTSSICYWGPHDKFRVLL
jgi:hypothetical protein